MILREMDYRPLTNDERMPHNQVVLEFLPGALRPSGGKDLACRSDKKQRVLPHADI